MRWIFQKALLGVRVQGSDLAPATPPPQPRASGTSARNGDGSRFGSYYQTSSRVIEVVLEEHHSKMFAKYRVTIFSDIFIMFLKIYLPSSGVSVSF